MKYKALLLTTSLLAAGTSTYASNINGYDDPDLTGGNSCQSAAILPSTIKMVENPIEEKTKGQEKVSGDNFDNCPVTPGALTKETEENPLQQAMSKLSEDAALAVLQEDDLTVAKEKLKEGVVHLEGLVPLYEINVKLTDLQSSNRTNLQKFKLQEQKIEQKAQLTLEQLEIARKKLKQEYDRDQAEQDARSAQLKAELESQTEILKNRTEIRVRTEKRADYIRTQKEDESYVGAFLKEVFLGRGRPASSKDN